VRIWLGIMTLMTEVLSEFVVSTIEVPRVIPCLNAVVSTASNLLTGSAI
jgi:hypothetical protein